MVKRNVTTGIFYRLIEIAIPFLAWTMILMPFALSPFRPALVSYFILAFFLYFLFKSIKTVYYASVAYQLMQWASKINWFAKLKKIKKWEEIEHFIIITNYKESIEKVGKTIEQLKNQDYDIKKIHIVLAMEEREGEEAHLRSGALTAKYDSLFGGIYTTYHPLIEGEVIGKASNEAYAGKYIYDLAAAKSFDPKHIIITVCDADSLLPKDYCAYVTLEFIKDVDRLYHFYWAPLLYYNNFWRLPLPVRVQSILSSVVCMSNLPQRDDLIQISTYSTNLWLLKSVDFWDTNIIPEDWHIWLQAFFKHGQKVRTLPIYLPVSADAVLSKGIFKTFKSRYEQERRWASGASDIPYFIKQSLITPHISIAAKLKKLSFMIDQHLLWPTSFFLLTISAQVPAFINPIFRRTVLGYVLPRTSALILTLTSVIMLMIIYFDHKLREQVKVKTRNRDIPMLFIQWYFLPVISFFFSSLPALEAHTRLLLGKKLEYKVTEKE